MDVGSPLHLNAFAWEGMVRSHSSCWSQNSVTGVTALSPQSNDVSPKLIWSLLSSLTIMSKDFSCALCGFGGLF